MAECGVDSKKGLKLRVLHFIEGFLLAATAPGLSAGMNETCEAWKKGSLLPPATLLLLSTVFR